MFQWQGGSQEVTDSTISFFSEWKQFMSCEFFLPIELTGGVTKVSLIGLLLKKTDLQASSAEHKWISDSGKMPGEI